jgi:hypothetical protein
LRNNYAGASKTADDSFLANKVTRERTNSRCRYAISNLNDWLSIPQAAYGAKLFSHGGTVLVTREC